MDLNRNITITPRDAVFRGRDAGVLGATASSLIVSRGGNGFISGARRLESGLGLLLEKHN
jgi:hypothetical protein